MATTDVISEESHADEHHDHPPFLAHHFDTPEQQFDSGKLGMWLFLVTEVLFFSGLFCAYAVYRAMRPEVFSGCSQFLNTQLGAINTGVLLFSSLTMAWAVRCAQTEEYKKLVGMLAATLSCATIFLGVKAIEYSHKFEMGLLPAGLFSYDPAHPHHHEGLSASLVWMSVPFLLILLGLITWYVIAAVGHNKFQMRVAGPLTVVAACYFVGVGLGTVIESGEKPVAALATSHAEGESFAEVEHGGVHGEGEHEDGAAGGAKEDGTDTVAAGEAEGAAETPAETSADATGSEQATDGAAEAAALDTPYRGLNPTAGVLAGDDTNTGVRQQLSAERRAEMLAAGRMTFEGEEAAIESTEIEVFNPAYAGVFFSIYYCMTGIHAIHILAGIGVLVWLLVRAVRHDFNRQYFGPVDYVGLYWHIVDLIWIYLFPLLYLIR